MSFTNQTTNLGLPQWQDTDEPTWLVDMNNAFAEIDKFAGNQDTKNDTVNAKIKDISDAQTIAGQNITKLQTDVSENTTQLTQLQAQQNINTRHISELQDKIDETNSTVTQLSDTVLQNNNTLTDSLEQQSAKLASLENTQQEQGTDIAGAKTDIQQNTSNIQELQTDVNNLTTEVATNTTNIGTLQSDVQNIIDVMPSGRYDLLAGLYTMPNASIVNGVIVNNITQLKQGVYILIGKTTLDSAVGGLFLTLSVSSETYIKVLSTYCDTGKYGTFLKYAIIFAVTTDIGESSISVGALKYNPANSLNQVYNLTNAPTEKNIYRLGTSI